MATNRPTFLSEIERNHTDFIDLQEREHFIRSASLRFCRGLRQKDHNLQISAAVNGGGENRTVGGNNSGMSEIVSDRVELSKLTRQKKGIYKTFLQSN